VQIFARDERGGQRRGAVGREQEGEEEEGEDEVGEFGLVEPEWMGEPEIR